MKLQLMMDKFAIGLSAMCSIHCLAVPVLLVLLPSTAVLGLGNEQFHFWMGVLTRREGRGCGKRP